MRGRPQVFCGAYLLSCDGIVLTMNLLWSSSSWYSAGIPQSILRWHVNIESRSRLRTVVKGRDVNKDLTPKDQDKDKDLTPRTRTRTRTWPPRTRTRTRTFWT